jgi:chemotaxis protein MotB
MGVQGNPAPVIIKRKKVIQGGGHHGGAWKVAYADFVTAMMAFFMLMWLLNATTEQQRKGLADYFTPTVPINRISGGGDGAFGGDSIFSENVLPQNGTGASALAASRQKQAMGSTGVLQDGPDQETNADPLDTVNEALLGRGGESMVMDKMLEHVVTRVTDEGLVIELFALDGVPLFVDGSDTPTDLMHDLVTLVAGAARMVRNQIAVEGHVRAKPIVVVNNPIWDLSSARAMRTRHMLEIGQTAPQRIARITGHADREPATDNSMSVRNDRIEIILLRD